MTTMKTRVCASPNALVDAATIEARIMEQSGKSEQFVRELTAHQTRLYGYIFSLLADHAHAADVVQETNLVLWRKIDEFQPERPFLPWAFAIARFQVLAHLRDRKRDRLLLDAELIEAISDEAEHQAAKLDSFRDALRPCMQKLTPGGRDLIDHRYFRSMSVADVADAVGRTVGATKVALLRIRQQLAECVEKRMAGTS